MGQNSSRETDDESPYAGKDAAELTRLITERGIAVPTGRLRPDRDMLTALLQAYDIGVDTAHGTSGDSRTGSDTGSAKGCPPMDISVLEALQKIRDAPGNMGVDIGGTLVKMAIALPQDMASEYTFPEEFGQTGRTKPKLELNINVAGDPYVVRFVMGSTSQMESAVEHLGKHRSKHTPNNGEVIEEDSNVDDDDCNEERFSRMFSGWSDVGSASYRAVRRIATAGGGACKFAPLFRDALRVEIAPVKELSAVLDGLFFLASHHSEVRNVCSTGEDNASDVPDLFTVGEDGCNKPLPWPDPLFPLMIVNMGSGVSILRVDSANGNDFVRVGGTACGGSTFLGLTRSLTSAETFEDALALAEGGDATRVDKLVSDIYGLEGSASLGLPGNLTASNFGKLSELPIGSNDQACTEQDLARAVLQMVTQQSTLMATALARHAGCINRVFFVGGFVDEANWQARKAIAASFRSLGGCAYFLRHSDFLGALGSLKIGLQALETGH